MTHKPSYPRVNRLRALLGPKPDPHHEPIDIEVSLLPHALDERRMLDAIRDLVHQGYSPLLTVVISAEVCEL